MSICHQIIHSQQTITIYWDNLKINLQFLVAFFVLHGLSALSAFCQQRSFWKLPTSQSAQWPCLDEWRPSAWSVFWRSWHCSTSDRLVAVCASQSHGHCEKDAATRLPGSDNIQQVLTIKPAIYFHFLFNSFAVTSGQHDRPWCGFVLYRSATPVRYCPTMAPVLLWSPWSCRRQSRPFPSSLGLQSGSPPLQRLATQNRKCRVTLYSNIYIYVQWRSRYHQLAIYLATDN